MATRTTQGQEVIRRAKGEIEKRTGKTPDQLYQEREKRITDVIQMRVPDRMPVFLRLHSFAVRYAGLSQAARFYDIAAYRQAVIKTLLDFDLDMVQLTGGTRSGIALELLGTRQLKWPGGTLAADLNEQHVEEPTMKEDEYDLFLADPGDFILRYHLPRSYDTLKAFSKLPPLRSLLNVVAMVIESPRFSTPEVMQAFEAIFKAGKEQAKFGQLQEEIATPLGVPPKTYTGGGVVTPFDTVTDYLRGIHGTAVDMFKRPEKLFAAMDRILEWQTAMAVPADPKEKGKRRVGGGMAHWGSAAYLSKKQFEQFYWPGLKKSLLFAIDLGYVPVLYPEGDHDDRIECLLDLPKGKALYHTNICKDIFRFKEILGGHIAFMGGVPSALLHFGSPQEVDEQCKKLIGVCGKGGGYILSAAAVGEEDAKIENLKAMVDAVRKYGRYN